MAVVTQARTTRIRIGDDLQDWSTRLIEFTVRYEYLSQRGLIKTLGSLKLNAGAYPAPPESMNPVANIARWHRGQKVYVDYSNDARSLVAHPMANPLYVLKEPVRPFFADNPPTLELELGCILALRDFPQPDDDQSGITAGTSTTLQAVVTSLLSAAGISSVSLTGLSGTSRTAPAIKTDRQSFVQQAGQIAYGVGYYLFQNSSGEVEARAIDLSPGASVFDRQVGGNAGKELLYQPLDTGSETPVEKVTVKSVWSDASTPPVGSESPYFDETFEIEGIVGEVVPTSTQFYAKQITQRTRIRKYAYNSEGNQEIDLIEVSFPRGLINPDDSDPLTLIESRTTTITRTYDSNSRLIQIVTDVQEAKGLVNKAEASDFFQPTTALIETTANTFEAAEGQLETDQIAKQVVTRQQPKILTNPDEVTNPYEVHTAEKITRQWSRIGETEQFGFVESPQKAKILVNQNETADPYSLTFAPGGEVGASSDDRYQPPQAEYRTPDSNLTETEIEAVVYFDLSTGYERERVYQIPYVPDNNTARAIAERLGKWLAAARYAYEVGFALTDDVMTGLLPLIRSDWTEPDSTVIAYLLNGISLAYSQTEAFGVAHAYPVNPGIYTLARKLRADTTMGFAMAVAVNSVLKLRADTTMGFSFVNEPSPDRALSADVTMGFAFEVNN
jgi:hypothetical protein